MTCYRWKSTVSPGKLFFSKKTQKTAFIGGMETGVSWLWEELYAKLLGLGQLLGYPWKVWGITVQTSYWEGLWHQNCGYTSPILFRCASISWFQVVSEWVSDLFQLAHLWVFQSYFLWGMDGKTPTRCTRISAIFQAGRTVQFVCFCKRWALALIQ